MAVSPSPSPSHLPHDPSPPPPKADAADPPPSAENPSPAEPPLVQPSLPLPPSFRPVAPNYPAFVAPGIHPPGVPAAPQMGGIYAALPRPFPPHVPAGYVLPVPGQSFPPLGVARYSAPYAGIVRPRIFSPRPHGALPIVSPLSRPPVPGMPPIVPVVRSVAPTIAPAEKPQTTVYVGKIASTVDDDFLLPALRLCGPVKSWKRARDPSNGTPKSFAFCEFESAEGVLRALRLLSKLSIDGQELVLNVNQATRSYLERYVEKKTEREKLKESEAESEGAIEDTDTVPVVETIDIFESASEERKTVSSDTVDEDSKDPHKFGIVTDDDREADREALGKLTSMIDERIKNMCTPSSPSEQSSAFATTKPSSEVPAKSKDVDSDSGKNDSDEDKNDDETSENRPSSEQDKIETSSAAKNKKHDRSSREKDRQSGLKREREREIDRYERERERERVRRERDREVKIRETDRLFKERVKEWESRERDKEYQRQHERDRDKEKERERRREIKDQEEESDDEDGKKRRRRSTIYEERRRKRRREKEDDSADRFREEVEIVEAKSKAVQKEVLVNNVIEIFTKGITTNDVSDEDGRDQAYEDDSAHVDRSGFEILGMGENDCSRMDLDPSDTRHNNGMPARKLGFGLVGSGKRTNVLSVFHEADEEDANKEKKMRPLVPIDYSKEELQAVQGSSLSGGMPSNLAAAAEFAKRISNGSTKDVKNETDKERNKWLNDKSSKRARERSSEEISRGREDEDDKAHISTTENKKLLDAKQLIDMIPKTKEELFSYEINWTIYDKHDLHERMRPWISKKITEFLGEEEATLVEYIVSSTKEHVKASQMLELLQPILDEEAEMFVLKMWRMLIFEIKKVETGLSLKPRS